MRCKLPVYKVKDLAYRHSLELVRERIFHVKCEEFSAKQSRYFTERSEDLTATTKKTFEE